MSNLLKLKPEFRVVLPEGATGGTGKLEYQGVYKVAAMLAGASTRIKVILDTGNNRLGKIVNVTNNGDVLVLGAMLGDPIPPYVKLTIYPTVPSGKADPIIYEGRPHEHPTGSGFWDFEDIGADPLGATLASREDKLNLTTATAAAQAAAGSVTAAITDLTAEKATLAQFVADKEADIAQNQELQNARLAALNLPPWAVTDSQPEYVEITQLRDGAIAAATVVLHNSGIVLPTVEVELT